MGFLTGAVDIKGTQPLPKVHPGEEWVVGTNTPNLSLSSFRFLPEPPHWPNLNRNQNTRKPGRCVVQSSISRSTEQEGERHQMDL